MDLKDHKNIQTEQTQDAQSLFSPSHLLPACNHRPRVSHLARFNTPRSHFSPQKNPLLVKYSLQMRSFGCCVKHSDPAGVKQGWIKAAALKSVCSGRVRLQLGPASAAGDTVTQLLPHSSDLRRDDRYAEPRERREDASEAGGEVKRKGCRGG